MFQPDDIVVYPAQGVGRIERIDHQKIGGVDCEMYIVRILNSNITLMVPVRGGSVGLRVPVSKAHAQKVLDQLLAEITSTVTAGQNWHRRFREYSEKIKSPEPGDVALVARELLCINRNKELSFGERRLLEQALGLLVGELSLVLGTPETALRETIHEAFASPPPPDVGPGDNADASPNPVLKAAPGSGRMLNTPKNLPPMPRLRPDY